jgi:hypothetical protein
MQMGRQRASAWQDKSLKRLELGFQSIDDWLQEFD